jgi:hypothetical protein
LPRRLGDDPLNRARAGTVNVGRATDVEALAHVGLDSLARPAAYQPEIQAQSIDAVPPTRQSHNDVFFQRRAEESSQPTGNEAQELAGKVPEVQEISEISEIPEIREVAAAPPVSLGPDVDAIKNEAPETSRYEETQQAPAFAPDESLGAIESGSPVKEPTAGAEALVEAKELPMSLPPAFQTQNQDVGQPKPEVDGASLNRLFGKLEK